MLTTQIQCLLVMSLLALIGFGPLSLTCLIGFYIVAVRPPWFPGVIRSLYGRAVRTHPEPGFGTRPSVVPRLKTAAVLLVLLILDIAPVPVTGSIGLYVILARPAWFERVAYAIYGQSGPS
jgi:hypothetical protein